jgi:transposase
MYFGGIDAHAHYLAIAVVDKSGVMLFEGTVSTQDPDELLAMLAPFRPLEVVVETCGFWPWIHDVLVPAGITFHLAHAKQLRAIAQAAQKNDAVDAALLARMLATGLIPKAYPKPPLQRERLRLVRHRAALVRQRTLLANRIHAQLHQSRIALPRERLLRRAARAWLETEARHRLTREQQRLVATHFEVLDILSRQIRELDGCVRQEADAVPAALLLRTIPGIGPFWSLLLSQELEPVERFPRCEHLVSYAGLAPVTRSTGGHTRHGRIPASANRWVRWALVSAIPKHVLHAPDSALSHYYAQLKARVGWRTARVATARKLARIIHHMLRVGETWRSEPPTTEDAKGRAPMNACSSTTALSSD